MNEYCIKYAVKYYQKMQEIRTCFVKAESGEEAWYKVQNKFLDEDKNKGWFLPKEELEYINILNIRRL